MAADPPPPIALFDLHDRALQTWRSCAPPARLLVHLDAHLDCEPYAPGALHIGNVVRAALREGLVSELWWIVPGPARADEHSWSVMSSEFARALDAPTGEPTIEGRPAVVTTLSEFRGAGRGALLDIDVDYLCYPARRRDDDRPAAAPWLWPGELVEALERLVLSPAIVTIASSLTGGFTPMRWKHLGDELALRLAGNGDRSVLDVYARLRETVGLAGLHLVQALERVVAESPGVAAVWFHFADALYDHGRLDDARAAFARAVAIDPGYRHLYRTAAPLDQATGQPDRARAGYERALALDPADPFSRIGLAQLAEREGRGADALRLFEEALALPGGEQIETYRGIGRLLEEEAPERAIAAYEQSLKLALAGRVPLSAYPSSNVDGGIMDPGHAETYARVARLHERAGRSEQARVNQAFAAALRPRGEAVDGPPSPADRAGAHGTISPTPE